MKKIILILFLIPFFINTYAFPDKLIIENQTTLTCRVFMEYINKNEELNKYQVYVKAFIVRSNETFIFSAAKIK